MRDILPGSGLQDSHVLIVVTGGTICMQRSPDGFVPAKGFLEQCLAPRPSFNDGTKILQTTVTNERGDSVIVQSLRTPSTAYSKKIRYAVLEFEQLLDSSSIDADDWVAMAQTILWNYPLFDGFVVLHGTDSLAYTSSALSFMLQDLGKPVVLTGSQRPMIELQNDATDNLLGSMIVAGHFMIPEVCLFFHYNLFRGNRCTKIASSDFAAFASPNHLPLATVSAAGTKVNWHLVHRPTRLGAMSVQKNFQTAHVACLRIFPGIKPEMIEAVLGVQNLRGLVLETFGSGNIPEKPGSALITTLAQAVERGVVVINVTQCLSGNVSPTYASGTVLGRAGIVFGHDLTTEAALTKLGYLLGLANLTPKMIAEKMSLNLQGELTEAAKTHFEHPTNEQLPANAAIMAVLGHAIIDGRMDTFREILGGKGDELLNHTDYLGNTPLHLAATADNTDILKDLLLRGASVHVRNHAGHTPLYVAADTGHSHNVKLLREAGAHIHHRELNALQAFIAGNSAGSNAAKGTAWDLALSCQAPGCERSRCMK